MLDEENHSDHHYITYTVQTDASSCRRNDTPQNDRSWITSKGICVEKFKAGLMLADWISPRQADVGGYNIADAFEKRMTVACDFALQRKPEMRCDKRPQHWWNPEIAQLRSSCTAARRALKRAASRRTRNGGETAATEHLLENLKSRKKALRTEIAKSKERAWKELLETVEKDVWGKPYKLVLRKLQGPPVTANMEPTMLKEIVATLFPTKPPPSQI